MTPDPGNMEQLSAEIALGNDLHYSQLVPQVGFHFPIQTNYGEDFAKSWPFLSVFVQSAVFTLGFTPSDRSLVGKMEKLGKTSSQLEQQLVPSFPRPGLADRGMPEGGGGGDRPPPPPHTQTLLNFSSPSSSPSSSLVVSSRSTRSSRSSRSSRKGKSRSSKPSLEVILAKVGLQRLQPVLEAQEVDLPALLELDDKVGLSRKVNSFEVLIVSMSKDLKELGLVDSKEREMLREQLDKIKRK